MWDPQVPALAERYRVVTYDTRGHGESPAPAGPYTLDDLVDDLVALLDEVGAQRAHVAGLSLGGMTGDAAGRPGARSGSTGWPLLCTSAKPDPTAVPGPGGRRPLRGHRTPGAGRGQPLADAAVRRRAPRPGRAAGGDDRRLRTTRATPPAARSSRGVDLRERPAPGSPPRRW